MKGVIVEIHNHKAALLSEEGCVIKISNNNYNIGQEVEINMKKTINFKKAFAFASIAACLVLMFSISVYAYYTPYSYVSLDVNPSIEYSVNRFGRVLSVKGVNDDGTDIIESIKLDNLKNKTIEDAISLTVDKISDAGYLDSDAAGIVITTSSDNMTKAGELAQTLEKVANKGVDKNNHEAVVNAEAVGAKRVAEAQKLGVTPGKLNLVEKMITYADNAENINKEEWLHKSVKDIMAETNKYKEQDQTKKQTQTKEQTQGQEQNQEQEQNQIKEQNAGEEPKNQEQNTNEEKNGETIVNGNAKGQSENSEGKKSNNDAGSNVDNGSNSGNDSNAGNGSESDSVSNSGNGLNSGSSTTRNPNNKGN